MLRPLFGWVNNKEGENTGFFLCSAFAQLIQRLHYSIGRHGFMGRVSSLYFRLFPVLLSSQYCDDTNNNSVNELERAWQNNVVLLREREYVVIAVSVTVLVLLCV